MESSLSRKVINVTYCKSTQMMRVLIWKTFFESSRNTQMVFQGIYYKKKLPHIMRNEVKPNKQKNNKNDDHNGAHNGTTTHRLQADG
jgi:hypothetical protein